MSTKTEKKKEKKEKEEPTRLEKLVLNITEPMKMDNQEITLEQLTVLVGQNSSGKSFFLKTCYALGAVGVMRLTPPDIHQAAQFVFDHTFDEQNFNGLFKAVYTKGLVAVELKKGKVEKVEVEGTTAPVTYMSSDMRLFSNMVTYLRLRKTCISDPLTFMKKMLEAYRLYNFTYMEGLIAKLPFMVPGEARLHLKVMDFPGAEDVVSVDVDTEACEFHVNMKDGKKANIVRLGNGHQAILNMMLGAYMA